MFFDLTVAPHEEICRLIHQGEALRRNEANVAQLVVRLICNQTVGGSSPSVGSNLTQKTVLHILKRRSHPHGGMQP